ncbi:MAG: hypothetical protein JXR03_15005 [Cyclobacteriaceae bacterium]
MKYLFFFLITCCSYALVAQSTDLPLGSRAYTTYDEWDVKSERSFFTTVKPISRKEMSNISKQVSDTKSITKRFDQQYIKIETREYQDSINESRKPVFGRFYGYNSDFVSVNQDGFDFHMNPVFGFRVGKENNSGDLIFQNYRGLEMRGTIDDKVSFYSLLTENQARFPTYVRQVTDSTLGVPYEGFWKQYNETGVDFLRAQAYIDFNVSRHISAQFGYGKHFVGNGRRSLILSDFGNNYPYLRLKTQVWKFQYTNIFAQLIAETRGGTFGLFGTGSFPKKYLAFHRLEVNLTKKLNIGLFESVIYGKPDSLGNNGVRAQYLNPIIFYRALEQQDGSADNAILGMDFKWNLFKSISLYGQLVIDELIVSKAFSGDGYWENKQAFQLGAKYINSFGIDGLMLQAEWNQVRPYTYAHQDNYTSYSHYNMPLAHPLGANFREILLSGNYRITPKLTASGELLLAKYGVDIGSLSYGGDILKSYNLKTGDVGIDLLQGDETSLMLVHGKLSYQWFHNLFTDIDLTYRKESSVSGLSDLNSSIFSFTLRYNFPNRDYLF